MYSRTSRTRKDLYNGEIMHELVKDIFLMATCMYIICGTLIITVSAFVDSDRTFGVCMYALLFLMGTVFLSYVALSK
jgi:hypothetical protein